MESHKEIRLKILYATSFNESLYEQSGKELIDSFLKHQTEDLYVSYEGFQFEPDNDRILACPLENNDMLLGWTKQYSHLIDVQWGGTKTYPKDKANSWRRQAGRWFRKIASLHEVTSRFRNYDAVVFIDCDCIIHKAIESNIIEDILSKYKCFFHCGHYRTAKNLGIESGFIGFSLQNGYNQILDYTFTQYMSGNFIKEPRWDDAWMLMKSIAKHPDNCLDIVVHLEHKDSDVIEHGIFGQYLVHNKGKHIV